MGYRKYTLGKMAQDGLLVTVRCPRCGREASFLSSELMVFYGTHKVPSEVPFVCKQCGGRKLGTRVESIKPTPRATP